MKREDKNTLAKLLNEWFTETNFDAKNVWNENEVARIIASNIRQMGRWKKNMDPSHADRVKNFRFRCKQIGF